MSSKFSSSIKGWTFSRYTKTKYFNEDLRKVTLDSITLQQTLSYLLQNTLKQTGTYVYLCSVIHQMWAHPAAPATGLSYEMQRLRRCIAVVMTQLPLRFMHSYDQLVDIHIIMIALTDSCTRPNYLMKLLIRS